MKKKVFVAVLVITLLFTACSRNKNAIAEIGDNEIIDMFSEKRGEVAEIIRFQGNDGAFALVELLIKDSDEIYNENHYYLLNLVTKKAETLYVVNCRIENIINENYMIFTSNSPNWRGWPFPYTYNLVRINENGNDVDDDKSNDTFKGWREAKYLKLEEPTAFGFGYPCDLININLNISGVELLFKPIFYAGGMPAMPQTDVSYDKTNNRMVLKIQKCNNAVTQEDIELALKNYSHFVNDFKITQENDVCLLSLYFKEDMLLYNIEKENWYVQDKEDLVYARINLIRKVK